MFLVLLLFVNKITVTPFESDDNDDDDEEAEEMCSV